MPEEDQFDISKMDTCLDNLAAAAATGNNVRLMKNNERLVEKLGALNIFLTV